MHTSKKTYDSKFVSFLSTHNTIEIKTHAEFTQIHLLLQQIGLTIPNIKNFPVPCYLEYDNAEGFAYYTKKESSVDWYGQEPFSVSEIIDEVNAE